VFETPQPRSAPIPLGSPLRSCRPIPVTATASGDLEGDRGRVRADPTADHRPRHRGVFDQRDSNLIAFGQRQQRAWHPGISNGRGWSQAPVIMTGTVHQPLELADLLFGPAWSKASNVPGMERASLPFSANDLAPDGSEVRLLLTGSGGGLAHFRLPPGEVSVAKKHRAVEELWYFTAGRGEMCVGDETTAVCSGVAIRIPPETRFQFVSHGPEPLDAVAATIPPWPGPGEAVDAEPFWHSVDG